MSHQGRTAMQNATTCAYGGGSGSGTATRKPALVDPLTFMRTTPDALPHVRTATECSRLGSMAALRGATLDRLADVVPERVDRSGVSNNSPAEAFAAAASYIR